MGSWTRRRIQRLSRRAMSQIGYKAKTQQAPAMDQAVEPRTGRFSAPSWLTKSANTMPYAADTDTRTPKHVQNASSGTPTCRIGCTLPRVRANTPVPRLNDACSAARPHWTEYLFARRRQHDARIAGGDL